MSRFRPIRRIVYLIEILLLALLIVSAVHAQNTSDQILYAIGNNGGDNVIYRVNLDNGVETQMGIVRNFGSEAGWSPDGKFIYLLDYNNQDNPSLTLIDIETDQRQKLADTLRPMPCSLPFEWSPNSEWLAYFAQSDPQTVLKLFNPTTGDIQALTDADPGYDEVFWSPDNYYLAYHSASERSDAISIRDMQNQKTVEVIHIQSSQFLKWSPTGNYIVFTPVDAQNIVIYNTADDTQHQYDATAIGDWSPDGKLLTLYRQTENDQTSLLVVDVLANAIIELDSEIASANVARGAAWSFDGRYLATAVRNADDVSKRTVYILDSSKWSVKHTEIRARDEDSFIWSPVVDRLAIITDIDFVGENTDFSSFWLLDVDQQQSHHYDVKIPSMSYEKGLNRSATGGYMLFYTDSGLASLNWASGELNLLDTPSQRFSRPRWSPDGMKVAAVTHKDIYVIMLEGNKVNNVTNTPDEIETFLGWRGANNGEKLSFCGEG